MNLTWQIIRKDLRRMASPVALWLSFVLVASVWFRLQSSAFSGEAAAGPNSNLVVLCSLVMVVQMLGLYVLAGALVMEDPMVSTTAFWLTRPISRPCLLVAKLLAAVVLFVAVPVVCLAAVWFTCGASVQEVGGAVAQCALLHGAVLCAAVAIASISTSLLQFLPWTLGFAVLWFGLATWTDSLSERAVRAPDLHPNAIVWQVLPVCVLGLLAARFVARPRAWAVLAFVCVLGAAADMRVTRPYIVKFSRECDRDVAPVFANRIDRTDAKRVPFVEATGTSPRGQHGTYRVPVMAWFAERRAGSAMEHMEAFQLDCAKLASALATRAGTPTIEWRMMARHRPGNAVDQYPLRLSGTWASVVVAGEVPLKLGETIRSGASRLVIREVARLENGDCGVVFEQHDIFAEPMWGVGNAVTDAFVVLDRAHHRARILDARSGDVGWLDWQHVKYLRVTIPGDMLPERERDASIVQVRFRSADPLPLLNVPGGAE